MTIQHQKIRNEFHLTDSEVVDLWTYLLKNTTQKYSNQPLQIFVQDLASQLVEIMVNALGQDKGCGFRIILEVHDTFYHNNIPQNAYALSCLTQNIMQAIPFYLSYTLLSVFGNSHRRWGKRRPNLDVIVRCLKINHIQGNLRMDL